MASQSWMVVGTGSPASAVKLQSIPIPKPKKGEVLVRLPWGRPENDFSGVIVDANGSTEFQAGDSVFGFVSIELSGETRQGALQEYLRVPTEFIVPLPPNVPAIDASGVALAAETAYQALFDCAKLEADQTVFINGGSSSVGAFAIQIAKARGISVVASASAKNEQFVRDLGADEFVDYTKQPLHTALAPRVKYDCILDSVGLVDPSLYTHSPRYLAPNGIYISTGPWPHSWAEFPSFLSTLQAISTPRIFGGTPRTWKFVVLVNKKPDLVAIQQLIAEGKVKPVTDYGRRELRGSILNRKPRFNCA
ncbi:hypothetical protein C8R43DRAFT_1210718 [Mycena crocata]|nr:hypothetical protein C8R43DRAFT_1210718 [Mycena crocata]